MQIETDTLKYFILSSASKQIFIEIYYKYAILTYKGSVNKSMGLLPTGIEILPPYDDRIFKCRAAV